MSSLCRRVGDGRRRVGTWVVVRSKASGVCATVRAALLVSTSHGELEIDRQTVLL